MKSYFLLIILSCSLIGCSDDSSFSGASANKSVADKKENDGDDNYKKESSQKSDDANAANLDDDRNTSKADVSEVDDIPKPERAITKGSFTVWTEPAVPAPGQDYRIVISVKLGKVVANYQRSDLDGTVYGTDTYTQSLAEGAGAGTSTKKNSHFNKPGYAPPSFDVDHQFYHYGATAKLSMKVPGAKYLVKDTIQVRSKLLNENQTITIMFK